jgi:hypothetical protein
VDVEVGKVVSLGSLGDGGKRKEEEAEEELRSSWLMCRLSMCGLKIGKILLIIQVSVFNIQS